MAQWESILGQQFAQIGHYFTIYFNSVLSSEFVGVSVGRPLSHCALKMQILDLVQIGLMKLDIG